MTVERIIRCDGPDCERWFQTVHPPPHVVAGFIETRAGSDTGEPHINHFCGWDCVLTFAAKFPPPEIIPMADAEPT